MMEIRFIAFDADDTLWENEHYFMRTEKAFCGLLKGFLPEADVQKELDQTGVRNVALYGFGIKSFMLSMIETSLRIAGSGCNGHLIERIISLGKKMLDEPVDLMPGVEEVLKELQSRFKLILATKGDILDQERKLEKSGLMPYFHHIEIMSDKKESAYLKIINHLEIEPKEFMMVGNSLKSDVIPVLNIGGYGVHIPYHITNIHERVAEQIVHPRFCTLPDIKSVLAILQEVNAG